MDPRTTVLKLISAAALILDKVVLPGIQLQQQPAAGGDDPGLPRVLLQQRHHESQLGDAAAAARQAGAGFKHRQH